MKIAYGGNTLTSGDVMKHLFMTGRSGPILHEIIRQRAAAEQGKVSGLKVSDEELQVFADNLRNVKGLYTAAETQAFLDRSGLTEDDFEEYCESALLANAFKDRLAGKEKIEAYFITHRPDFDRVRISVIVVNKESLASEIVMQISEDGEDFHALARKHSVDGATRHAGGYAGEVTRSMLPSEASAKVFAAGSGDVVGPLNLEGSFYLFLVEEVKKAELNDFTREMVRERMFDEWLVHFLKDGIKIVP